MENLIVFAVIAVIVALAGYYIYKEKKSGKACVGCPYAGTCGKSCSGNCGGCSDGKQ